MANDYRLKQKSNFGTIALVVGIVGIALSIAAYFSDHKHFYFAYLTAFAFWVSIALGTLFFTMLQHLTNASWSIVVRRISENLSAQLPWMFLFFIPVFLGLHELYHWTHEDAIATDELLQWKEPFLNSEFFAIRTVVYFLIWSLVSFTLRKMSLSQDENNDVDHAAKMRKVSAIGMLLFALSISFAGFDWLMSLDPHWYSTIFGVYYFAGGFLGSIALLILLCLYMRKKEEMANAITVEHFHDLGKLAFGFTIFWAYIGFSQYFLQWYGNIPEETVWYLHRWDGADGTVQWKWISMVLIFGRFFLPFFILIFRNVKRNFSAMRIMAVWLIVVHWIDIYWLVYPNFHHHGPHFSWFDLGPLMAIGGIFIWLFWLSYSSKPLVPVGDPKLQESINFVNH